jgi:HPt (histidine-containing phosphotransfer) domain-containing protein
MLRGMASDLGPDRAGRLLHKFLTETGHSVAALVGKPALDRAGIVEIHRLEGSAAMFGAVAFRQALSQLQTAFHDGSTEQVWPAIGGLHALWQQTQQAYDEVDVFPQLSSLR